MFPCPRSPLTPRNHCGGRSFGRHTMRALWSTIRGRSPVSRFRKTVPTSSTSSSGQRLHSSSHPRPSLLPRGFRGSAAPGFTALIRCGDPIPARQARPSFAGRMRPKLAVSSPDASIAFGCGLRWNTPGNDIVMLLAVQFRSRDQRSCAAGDRGSQNDLPP
jgi:hypothetical protein